MFDCSPIMAFLAVDCELKAHGNCTDVAVLNNVNDGSVLHHKTTTVPTKMSNKTISFAQAFLNKTEDIPMRTLSKPCVKGDLVAKISKYGSANLNNPPLLKKELVLESSNLFQSFYTPTS
ncbi:hypothetical protein TSUD_25530 [Trifolium subterraneum]|uniref:Uncharacterized protein n=1 Tax=Trifolium subterraneum TaxID=3900 RepID=A0A2Z6P0D6_TRISU|nr:hypothetical protein TSUD_25530 [Trifolium subterraneum]